MALGRGKVGISAAVTRGGQSWAYIYITLGFVLGLEAAVVAFVDPLKWPHNLVVYLALSAITIHLWLFSGWFQNKLIGWKAIYEDTARTTGLLGTAAFILAVVVIASYAWWWLQ